MRLGRLTNRRPKTGMGRCHGREVPQPGRIAVTASGRDNEHVSLREPNPVKVRFPRRQLLLPSAMQLFKLLRGAEGERTYKH